MPDKRLCSVYRSVREEGFYLFVDQAEALARVPAELLARLGVTELVTTLVLTPERRLARAEAGRVLEAIASRGYYLQMPPPVDADLQALRRKNEKLP